uniref:SAP domain-containing protein n=1 Tax=Globisporangium ultimum (strain ATCC 200006 / CBS 805.95 / DAOM BR144) TaxID=431595 RepID=K3WEJ2_GLOUD
MKVKELQAKLKKYKLDTTGVKDHLSGAFPTGKHQVDGGKGEHRPVTTRRAILSTQKRTL